MPATRKQVEWLTTAEAGKLAGVSGRTITFWINKGVPVNPRRPNGRRRFLRAMSRGTWQYTTLDWLREFMDSDWSEWIDRPARGPHPLGVWVNRPVTTPSDAPVSAVEPPTLLPAKCASSDCETAAPCVPPDQSPETSPHPRDETSFDSAPAEVPDDLCLG